MKAVKPEGVWVVHYTTVTGMALAVIESEIAEEHLSPVTYTHTCTILKYVLPAPVEVKGVDFR